MGATTSTLEAIMSNQKPTPNDQRSDVKNPNNPAHEADRRNREKQGHENAPPAQPPPPAAPPPQQTPKK
jgi:hypothetical protein